MEVKEGRRRRVCVTGAGGYVGSWVVKLLLSNGYTVHGTVRDPGNAKYDHLTKMEKASENLKLLKADLLDYDSLSSAISGCSGVIHIASPVITTPHVPDPQAQVLDPAVKGTSNVVEACVEHKVERVVVVSSLAAVLCNPLWKGRVVDESCWSDPEFCRSNQLWYPLSKTEAESKALEYAKTSGIDLVTICPSFVWGPMLQPTLNTSSLYLLDFFKEHESLEIMVETVVDVRDVAEAILMVYERPEARGRYLCNAFNIKGHQVVDKLTTLYPQYKYPNNIIGNEDMIMASSEKLERLGWTYRPLEQTIVDSVECYYNRRLMP